MDEYQLVIIGGGPAGLAAACAAWDRGLRRVLIIERDRELGGILNQCIHNGFGLHRFNEELTGPEYAGRYIDMLSKTGVEVKTDTMALAVSPERIVSFINPADGYKSVKAGAVVLAMGCRERTRGAISTPGTRCSGIFTAGAAQVIAGNILEAYTSNGASLSVLLYLRAFENGDFDSAWGIGAVLLILVLIINIAARLAKKHLRQKG